MTFKSALMDVLPGSAKEQLRRALRDYRVRSALRRIIRGSATGSRERHPFERLRDAWGNKGWSADTDYLMEIYRTASETTGPILECGSGLTTLLLAAAARRTGVCVDSLEHLPRWAAELKGALRASGNLGSRVHVVALADYGDYCWYEPPREVLERSYGLVICDGPPGANPGGRYGLLPVMYEQIRGATILADDAGRLAEREMFARWEKEFGTTARTVSGQRRPFARVEVPL